MARTRYNLAQRLLHWLIALLVFGMLAAGFTLGVLGYEGAVGLFGDAMTNQLYLYHKSFGILLFMLVVLRLLLFRFQPPPAHEPPLGRTERWVSSSVHLLIYVVLLGMPILGWIATVTGGFPAQFFGWSQPGLGEGSKDAALSQQLFVIHGIGGLLLLGLVLLHITGGLRHWRRKDGVMRRISLP